MSFGPPTVEQIKHLSATKNDVIEEQKVKPQRIIENTEVKNQLMEQINDPVKKLDFDQSIQVNI